MLENFACSGGNNWNSFCHCFGVGNGKVCAVVAVVGWRRAKIDGGGAGFLESKYSNTKQSLPRVQSIGCPNCGLFGFWATAVETRRWAMVWASAIGELTPLFLAQLDRLVNPTVNKIAEMYFFDSIVIRRLDVKAEVASEKSINDSE